MLFENINFLLESKSIKVSDSYKVMRNRKDMTSGITDKMIKKYKEEMAEKENSPEWKGIVKTKFRKYDKNIDNNIDKKASDVSSAYRDESEGEGKGILYNIAKKEVKDRINNDSGKFRQKIQTAIISGGTNRVKELEKDNNIWERDDEDFLIEVPKGAAKVNSGNNKKVNLSNGADYIWKNGNTIHLIEAKNGPVNDNMKIILNQLVNAIETARSNSSQVNKYKLGNAFIIKDIGYNNKISNKLKSIEAEINRKDAKELIEYIIGCNIISNPNSATGWNIIDTKNESRFDREINNLSRGNKYENPNKNLSKKFEDIPGLEKIYEETKEYAKDLRRLLFESTDPNSVIFNDKKEGEEYFSQKEKRYMRLIKNHINVIFSNIINIKENNNIRPALSDEFNNVNRRFSKNTPQVITSATFHDMLRNTKKYVINNGEQANKFINALENNFKLKGGLGSILGSEYGKDNNKKTIR